jgi:hypothetical protein
VADRGYASHALPRAISDGSWSTVGINSPGGVGRGKDGHY